jgi:hypothetical protein
VVRSARGCDEIDGLARVRVNDILFSRIGSSNTGLIDEVGAQRTRLLKAGLNPDSATGTLTIRPFFKPSYEQWRRVGERVVKNTVSRFELVDTGRTSIASFNQATLFAA